MSETTVGGVVGFLRIDADQAMRTLEEVTASVERLEHNTANIKVKADTAEAETKLAAVAAEEDKVDRGNKKIATSGKDAGRGMGALATAIITLGPALVPLAVGATGLSVAFGAMGAAGILAIIGIRQEMQSGSAVGVAYSGLMTTLTGDLRSLASVAAAGVLGPFTDSVQALQTQMPKLTSMIRDFSSVTGRTASALMQGLVAAFVALEPLARDAGVYLLTLTQRFAALMAGGGVTSFGDYVRSVFPQVMAAVENIVTAVIHLVAAFAPIGTTVLGVLSTFASLISAIPVNVLATVATLAMSVFLGFKAFSILTGPLQAVSGAVQRLGVSSETAAAGVRSLTIAAGAIGAILAVATFLYSRHAESVRQDQQAVDSYTEALRNSNGAIDENVRLTAFQQLQSDGAYQAARQLGISLNLVTDAALGSTSASAQLATQMQLLAAAQADADAGGKRTGRTSAETTSALARLTSGVAINTDQFMRAKQAQADWADASAITTSASNAQSGAMARAAAAVGTTVPALTAAAAAQQQQADSTAQATAKMYLENDAAGLLKQSLDLLNGKTLSAADAQNSFESSLANMGDHVTSTGKKITFTTTSIKDMSAASVALRGQLNTQIEGLQRVVEANGGLANSTGKARAQMVTMRQQIIDNAVAHGVDRKAVTAYVDSLLKIPKKVPPTKLDVDSAAAAAKVAAFQALINNLHGKTVSVVVGTSNKLAANPNLTSSANGNILKAFAGGGMENHVAQIAPAGAMRLWAEPETGGEAYIPLAPSKRARSTAIWEETGRMLGATGQQSGVDYEALGRVVARELAATPVRAYLTTGSVERAVMAGVR